MNWILSALFLLCYISFNNNVGKYVIRVFGFEKISISQTIIFGFLTTSFLQWLIGFPCQLFHLSWNIYFFSLLALYALLILGMIKYHNYISYEKEKLKIHIKNYWFLYIMAAVFLYWSISSQLPYLEMNYDDHFYIGSMVQQVGSTALSTENFFTGAFETVPFVRLVNTYEIGYAFWATLFHIDLPFFARFAMTYHNYLFVFMTFHGFFAILTKRNDKWLQYLILPFTILLIPGYYLQISGKLKMYDDWQFNTAIWYGGSVIRTTALPICLMLANEWISKPTIKKALFSILACAALLSYSSVFMTFAVTVFLIAMFMLVYKSMQINKNIKWLLLTILSISIIIVVIKIGPLVLEKIAPGYTSSLTENLKQYIYFRGFYGANSSVFLLYAFVLILLFFKIKSSSFRRMIVGIILLSLILYCGLFDKFFILVSFNVIFAGLRLMTSLQLLLISLVGYLLYLIIYKYKMNKLPALSAVCLLLGFSIFNIQNQEFYKKLAYPGTGLSSYGFDFYRIFKDDKLIPKVHSDIGGYLKNNDTSERHRIISPYIIPYEGAKLHLTAGLIMSSNNIEVCMSDNYMGTNGMNWGIANTFNSFVQGDITYEEVKDLLVQFRIEYIVTTSPVVMNSMLDQGMNLVVTSISSNEDVVYMIKTKFQ